MLQITIAYTFSLWILLQDPQKLDIENSLHSNPRYHISEFKLPAGEGWVGWALGYCFGSDSVRETLGG